MSLRASVKLGVIVTAKIIWNLRQSEHHVIIRFIVTNVEAGFHEFECSIGNESWKNGKSNLWGVIYSKWICYDDTKELDQS